MSAVPKNRGRVAVLWLVSLAVFAALTVASFQVVFRAHLWAWPTIHGPQVTIMSATGYSMGGAVTWSVVGAVLASFVPGFRRLPGRFFVAAGVLFFLLSLVEAYRIHRAVPPSVCSASFVDVLGKKAGMCTPR